MSRANADMGFRSLILTTQRIHVLETKNSRLNNPLTFEHRQIASQRLEISCLILCIPNVCHQVKMKWLQERWNTRGFQAEKPGGMIFRHNIHHFIRTRNIRTPLDNTFQDIGEHEDASRCRCANKGECPADGFLRDILRHAFPNKDHRPLRIEGCPGEDGFQALCLEVDGEKSDMFRQPAEVFLELLLFVFLH